GSLREHLLDEPAGGDQHVVTVGQVDDLCERRFRHERERPAGELEGVHVLAHGLQEILQVALPHRSVVGAADLGDAARARCALALVGTEEWKCSLTHTTLLLFTLVSSSVNWDT